jgi:branched-chain amino acid transport system substrate-binding protein
MSKKFKIIIGVIILALIVWGVIAIANDDNSGVSTDEPIKVGFIAPLTGEVADAGQAVQNTTRLAIEKINNNGGIDGRSIEVIYEDSKCNGAEGATVAQKLVNVDKVEIILGPYCSSVSLAIEPILTPAKVLMMTHSSSPELTGISKYFIRDYPSDASQGKVLAEVAYNDKGWRNVAFVTEQQDYTIGIYNSFQERFEELGGQVRTSEIFIYRPITH